jgi:two-component system, NarL family, nitrate/nitrite response regulator NarL
LIKKIKVLVAEDHHIVREGLINCLNLNENVVVVGEACNGVDALNKAKELNPDMILLDISMPELDGMEVLQIIKKRTPEIKVLILTAHYETEYIEEMRSKGADGYLLKNTTLSELNKAITRIHRGGKYFFDKQSEYKSNDLSDDPELTDRELQILRMLVSELSTKVIAEKLNLSVRTVETHRENVKKKLNAHSMISMVKAAIKFGYIDVK